MERKYIVYAVIALAIVTVAAVALALLIGLLVYGGTETIDYTSYGLPRNKYSKKVKTETVYESGRHYIGLTSDFIKFPRLPVTADYTGSNAVTLRTVEGFQVTIEVSFQYVILKEQVLPVYLKYGINSPATAINAQAGKVIRDVGQLYSAVDFIAQRRNITGTLYESLRSSLNETNRVTVNFLQLNKITFPSDYETQLVNRAVRNQQIVIADLNQKLNTVLSETQVYLAEITRKQRTIELETEGTIQFLSASAQGNSTILQLQAETEAYQATKEQLKLTNRELLRYMYYEALRIVQNGTMAVNVHTPLLVTDGDL
jgi:hypothetical protein